MGLPIPKRPSGFPLKIQRSYIDGAWSSSAGLKADGTCVAVGRNSSKQCNVTSWTGIVAVACGYNYTAGLKADGTVVAVGGNDYGQCDVTTWTNIVAIACGNSHTVGLKADGTCVSVGRNAHGECDVTSWTNIVAIGSGNYHTAGLKADGTCVAVGNNGSGQCNVTTWTNIVAIDGGGEHTVGLKEDGTCVAVGSNYYVTTWTNIVAIACGGNHTVGLKADGTVVAVGDNSSGQCNVTSWVLATPTFDTTGLLTLNNPISLADYTAITAVTVDGTQPTGTQRAFALKVDDVYQKVNSDGTLTALATQTPTVDSVLAEGNTAEELNALTDVPALVGKNVYPVIALQADTDATDMPTAKVSFTATRTDEVKTREFLSDMVRINGLFLKQITKDVTEGATITIAIYDGTTWSDYMDLDDAIGQTASSVRIKAVCTVDVVGDVVEVNEVKLTYSENA